MSDVERIQGCPMLTCTPQARSEHVCYGKNGVRRACMLLEGEIPQYWAGPGAWAGPADALRKEGVALMEEMKQ